MVNHYPLARFLIPQHHVNNAMDRTVTPKGSIKIIFDSDGTHVNKAFPQRPAVRVLLRIERDTPPVM
jgi:hypothetical protein